MIHPLLIHAIIAPRLRATPMSLVLLVTLLDGRMDAATPRLVKIGATAHRLRTDRVTLAHALDLLVREGYLVSHGRTTRGVGWYTLGNGLARLAHPLPAAVPRLEAAA